MKKGLNSELLKALAAVFLGLVVGAVLMLVIGKNPIAGYVSLFRGGLMNAERSAIPWQPRLRLF